MGAAGAGQEAVASDASTAMPLHNPAGMTRLQGHQILLGAGAGVSTVKFDPDEDTPMSGDDGGNAGSAFPLIGTYYAHSLTDDLKVGLSVLSLTGASLDYGDDWTGRFLVQDVTLLTVSLNTSAAYRVTEWLSLAAGFTVMYAQLEMNVAVPGPRGGEGQATIDGDDTAYGYNFGALLELSPHTRVGIIYMSEIELDFSGDVDLDPSDLSVGIDTEIPLAQLVRLGLYQDLSEQFTLLLSLGWEDWSTFDNQNISTERLDAKVPRKWKDTIHASIGLQYRPVEQWLLQTGVTYDSSPVDTSDRTPDLPIDDQLRVALGAQYDWTKRLTIGGALEYVFLGEAEINRDRLRGEYSRNDIFFFAFNASWKFGGI
jgi:long-chain fatty acid transport protein